MNEMMLRVESKTTGETLRIPVYAKEDAHGNRSIVIPHRWCNEYCYKLPAELRPTISTEIMDLSGLPGIPAMFAVKVVLKKDGTVIEQIGELLCSEWQNSPEISKKFPLTTCQNMAFDRAFIRYLQLTVLDCPENTAIYSSSEIPIPEDGVTIGSKTVATAEEPDTDDSDVPPEYPWAGNGTGIAIQNIAYDRNPGRVLISTNIGQVMYDVNTGRFLIPVGSTCFNKEVLSDIYRLASEKLGEDLSDYARGNFS